MSDFKNFLDLLKDGLAVLNTYKAVTEFGPKLFRLGKGITKRKYYDIDEIFPNVLERDINLGDIVECSGFITKYSQTFLPMSFESSVPGQASEKAGHLRLVNGRLQQEMNLKVSWTSLQAPVSIIPPLGDVRLCFLYNEDFNGFIYPVNDGKDNPELKNKIMVPKSGKPIPVLINTTKHSGLIDRYVNLKARVSFVPQEISKYLTPVYNNLLLEHNCNFFNPISEISPFICLSLLENDTDIKAEISSRDIPKAEAQVFTEFHVEDLDKYTDVSTQIIEGSIPDLASKGIRIMTVKGYEVKPYLTTGNIRFLYKEPNIVGLYTTTDLFDRKRYEETIKNMSNYTRKLSRNIQNNSFEVLGKRLKTHTDFVFDPTKALLFDSRGVLNIKDEYIPNENSEIYRNTVDWYSRAGR